MARLFANNRLSVLLVAILSLTTAVAQAAEVEYIWGTNAAGVTQQLAVNRYPALYTGDFGDCLGGESLFNITKFDAAYYSDNLTVVFHLDGTSNVRNESLMLHITVDAYGENRFEMTFNPCSINIPSLCPLNASIPVTAYAAIPVGPLQVGGIPTIAFSIPDFEGVARMQIFANSSQTEIGCFQASMSNGNSFGQPQAIAPVLGIWAATAMIASFLMAAYGVSVPHMRTHYAHSLSALIVFETFQSIFFSGVLNVEWPSILLAWWSNFAWAAGMIPAPAIIRSINPFAGVSGNASQVGGAGSTIIDNGGGLAQTIYGRDLMPAHLQRRAFENMSLATEVVHGLTKRAAYNASDPFDYSWSGGPVGPGIPLPGTLMGFPATLSPMNIPARDAFTLGLIWLLILLVVVAICLTAFKGILELLAGFKLMRQDILSFFRAHWVTYTYQAVLRGLFMAFGMMMILALYQFTLQGSPGASAVAGVVFFLFLIGVGGVAAWACHTWFRQGKFSVVPDRITFQHAHVLKKIPFILPIRASTLRARNAESDPVFSLPYIELKYNNDDPSRTMVHQDKPQVQRFGWLSARYRRTRWWYFMFYLGYLFIRACFIGGAANSPHAQIYGLLVFDILSFIVIVKLSPFESARNTAMGVWILGICKVATTGLSIAFLPAFNLNRIIATVIGVIIIVIQGFSVIALMILVVLGIISSRWSLSRNREQLYNKAHDMEDLRIRYFETLETKAADLPPPPPVPKPKRSKGGKGKSKDEQPEVPEEPHFSVNAVRRAPKIEDESEDTIGEIPSTPFLSRSRNNSGILDTNIGTGAGATLGPRPNRASYTNSLGSRYSVASMHRAGRIGRMSWSSRDFAQWDAERTIMDRSETSLVQKRMSSTGIQEVDDDGSREGDGERDGALTISSEFGRKTPAASYDSRSTSTPPRSAPSVEESVSEAQPQATPLPRSEPVHDTVSPSDTRDFAAS